MHDPYPRTALRRAAAQHKPCRPNPAVRDLLLFPRVGISRQFPLWIIDRRSKSRRQLWEQHQAGVSRIARGSIENAWMARFPYQVSNHPGRRLNVLQERQAFPVAIGLGPDWRPMLGFISAGKIHN